ncbi:MAG: hypothetical protein ABJC05_11480, partial [Pyrinomonadaceae bacterium]
MRAAGTLALKAAYKQRMYCPTCGSEERQHSQYCRACGTDLRVVRVSLEKPDSITESAITAREQIGRAVAEKIREVESTQDLKRVAEDVLPQIEKFLESPAEKRLRRARAGMITAASGLGAVVLFLLMSMIHDIGPGVLPGVGLGILAFIIGLGLVINGLLLTVPKKRLAAGMDEPLDGNLLDNSAALRPASMGANRPTNELDHANESLAAPGSV